MKRELAALAAREWDLVVVGGGIHGAAVAWDAAQRGLAVALVEREDFGAGASWNSLKTIHGGMRHLQRLDVGLAHASRRASAGRCSRIAPELVEPLPFLVPCRGHGSNGRAALALGLFLNDLLTCDRNRGLPADRQIPAGRTIGAAEALRPGAGPLGTRPGRRGAVARRPGREHRAAAASASSTPPRTPGPPSPTTPRRSSCCGPARPRRRCRGARRPGRERARAARAPGGERRRAVDRRARRAQRAPARSGCRCCAPATSSCGRPPCVPLAVGRAARAASCSSCRGRAARSSAPPTSRRPRRPATRSQFLDEAARAFPWAGIERRRPRARSRGPGAGGGRRLTACGPARASSTTSARTGPRGSSASQGVKYTTARAVAERAVDLSLPTPRTAARRLPDGRDGTAPRRAA